MTATQRANGVAVGAFVDELVRSGVQQFCISPGSRSTPLALAVARHPGARSWVQIDERSSGFFALGMAKALQAPVALVCTSGTAAANYLPAVVEAALARVPLVVLTADRPHELRDVGAAQTIDQVRLYGSHTRWFFDLGEPDVTPESLRHLRGVAARAASTARTAPAGPVHINCPYREPLVPIAGPAGDTAARAAGQAYTQVVAGARALEAGQLAALADELAGVARGLIVCGPQDDPALAPAVVALAGRLGFPILADPLSGVRCGPHDRALVLDAYDAVLRVPGFVERHAPELVLRFGALPTSKPVLQYLQRHARARQLVVDGGAGWNEPTGLAERLVYADGAGLCVALRAALPASLRGPGAWAQAWLSADRAARRVISAHLAAMPELFEGKVFSTLAELLPDGALLFAGNSMPVRDMDTFTPGSARAVRFMANRGANGIDGVVSSALGAAAASGRPAVLAIGDLSLYHDSNGLLAAKRYGIDLTIVLLNNDGGGIFSFLPQASETDQFEALFGTPTGLEFRLLAELYGARYTRVAGWPAFHEAVRTGIESGGLHLVEVATDRQHNVAQHRAIWPLVEHAVER